MSEPCQGTCSTCGDLCAGAERDERIAARDALLAEVDRLQEKVGQSITHAALDHMAAEVNRLRAVLEETPENIESVSQVLRDHYPGSALTPRLLLAALRARAGLTDSNAAEGATP